MSTDYSQTHGTIQRDQPRLRASPSARPRPQRSLQEIWLLLRSGAAGTPDVPTLPLLQLPWVVDGGSEELEGERPSVCCSAWTWVGFTPPTRPSPCCRRLDSLRHGGRSGKDGSGLSCFVQETLVPRPSGLQLLHC